MLFNITNKSRTPLFIRIHAQIHSAQTYTVKVSNPDPLADDPDRWRRLFAQFGHVSYVTVVRGNGALLRAMSKRRKAGRILEGSTANSTEVGGSEAFFGVWCVVVAEVCRTFNLWWW